MVYFLEDLLDLSFCLVPEYDNILILIPFGLLVVGAVWNLFFKLLWK